MASTAPPSVAHELALPELRDVELQLRKLERHSRAMWALAAGLLIALGATILSMVVAPQPDAPPLAGPRYMLIVGLGGLVMLFSLYMLLKQHQLHVVRSQLFEAVVRAESLRSRLSGLSSLFEGLAIVGVHFELEAALQTLAEHVRASLGSEQCSILLLDPETRELYCVAVAGSDAEFVRDARVRLGDGVAGWVAQNDEPVVLTPDVVDEKFPSARKPLRGIISGLCVPLSLPDRVIGVLSVNRLAHGPAFTAEDAKLVSIFASHIATATRRMQEREQAMRSLREHEEQLRHSQKMEALGRLASGVSHDFNNLLTTILAYGGKVARNLPEGDKLRGYADRVCDAAERCASLTRKLASFSRKQVADSRVIDLNHCLTAMGDSLRGIVGQDIAIDQRFALELRPVRVDPTHIEQVVLNIVVNARDAIAGSGRVTLETANVQLEPTAATRYRARPGDYVAITVRDTGCGMTTETRSRAFEPFFTTKSGGSGLGLSTVYGIVQQNGGFITLDSEPGQGTTFKVHFPAAQQQLTPALPEWERATPDQAKATILVVEDEENVRQLVREFLLSEGHSVLTSSWAGEAAVLAESSMEPIDLVITDVVLPGESGADLARWMQRIRPGVPVLFMSGYPDADVIKRGVSPRTNEFLQKPFSKDELMSRVATMLIDRPGGSRDGMTTRAA